VGAAVAPSISFSDVDRRMNMISGLIGIGSPFTDFDTIDGFRVYIASVVIMQPNSSDSEPYYMKMYPYVADVSKYALSTNVSSYSIFQSELSSSNFESSASLVLIAYAYRG
jgi:hypothetical protein